MSSSDAGTSHFVRFARDFLTYGVMSALSRVSNLLLLPVLTRVLSVDEYGVVDMVAMAVTLVAIGIKLGAPSALARYLNDGRGERAQKRLFTTLLLFLAGFGLLLVGLLLVVVLPLMLEVFAGKSSQAGGYRALLQYGCWIGYTVALASLPKMLLRLQRRIVTFNLAELFETSSYVALAFILVVVGDYGIAGVFLSQLLSQIASLIILLVITRQSLCRELDVPSFKRALRYSLPLVPMTLVSRLNSQVNRLVLLAVLGLSGVGIFGAAARICAMFELFLLAFRQTWQPLSMSIIDAPDRDTTYRRLLNYYAGATAAGGLLFISICPEIFQILLGPEYHEGVYLAPWLIGAAVFHQSGWVTNLGLLLAEKTPKLVSVSILTLVVTAGMSWWLITSFGLRVAACGSFVAEGVSTCVLSWLSTRHSTVRFDGRRVLVIVCTFTIVAPALIALGQQEGFAWPLLAGRLSLLAAAVAIILRCAIDRYAVAFVGASMKKLWEKGGQGEA